VYDMYDWSPPDTPSDGNGRAVPGPRRPAFPATAIAPPQESTATAAQAVQVALDRRDNGGRAPGEA
jgi:hypothetical protein